VIGFLAAGALAGLAGLAWPLYLHLFRRRQPRIVVVPSLVLFSLERRKDRRRRVSDLLLLLSRLLILTALCLVVARPWLRTRWGLPLPLLDQDQRVLGVVVDTSLRALGRDDNGTRFEQQRDWLVKQLAALPADVAVALATTTQPMAAPLLAPPEAARLLATMHPAPVAGNVSEAVRVLQEQMAGMPSLLCVVASRDLDLWPDEEQRGRLLIHDTTGLAPPQGIRRVAWNPADPDGFEVDLFGFDATDATLPSLVFSAPGGQETVCPVSAQEVLQGHLRAVLPNLPRERTLTAAVAGSDGAWDRWYLAGEAVLAGGDTAWLVADESAPSQTAKALLVAALQAVRPNLRLRVLAADSLRDAPSRMPGQLVLLALASSPPGLAELVARVLAGEGRVSIFCPPVGGDLPGLSAWGEMKETKGSPAPGEGAESWLPVEGLELSGLADLRLPRLRPPATVEDSLPLLTVAEGVAALGLERDRGRIVACGIPLDLATDSPVFHPVFPHLLAGLVCGSTVRSGTEGWTVGDRPTVAELFGSPDASGEVVAPDQTRHRVPNRTDRVFLALPGLWRLAGKGSVAGVNLPRPAPVPPPTVADWTARHPGLAASWTTAVTSLGDPGLYRREGARAMAYDASAAAAILLLMGLVGEGVLRVWATWRGRTDDA